jgi:hypothetical protein
MKVNLVGVCYHEAMTYKSMPGGGLRDSRNTYLIPSRYCSLREDNFLELSSLGDFGTLSSKIDDGWQTAQDLKNFLELLNLWFLVVLG